MKRIFQVLFLALIAIGYTACQPDSFREVYPAGDPQLQATMLTEEVNFGSDSITFEVTITEKETPLSTLAIKVIVGINVIANEEVRTPGLEYKNTFTYAVPFGPNMPEGEAVKVYLTATNVEGTVKNVILDQCVGHRPAIETMYVMPPTIDYKPLGKGKQMTWDGEKFVAYDLGYPKSIECLLAVVGTKFGRVDWTKPVLGMLNGKLSLITEEQFNANEASSIVLANDNLESIDTITFDPLTFELYFSGKVAQPVSALDVTIQAQVLKLLLHLQKEMDLSIIFISHDLRVVYNMCNRIYIMKDGEVVESGDVKEVYKNPKSDYTKRLLTAANIRKK